MGNLPADPAALEGRAAGEPGIALSGAAPAGAAGADRGGMGQFREQPPGEVLSAHPQGTPAAGRGAEELGAPGQRGREGPLRILGAAARTESAMLRHLAVRLGSLFRRERLEQELDAELRYHVDMLVEQNVAAGMSPAAARREALRVFGTVDGVKDDVRDKWLSRFVEV